ncbi:MAG: NADH-quinone oxidoreductase subunit NuoN [Alphaproteobacteria bacterium]|nr:NADH-quinone oxidoreductase subunit NuoN [Alphaproteobacteria bacterium]
MTEAPDVSITYDLAVMLPEIFLALGIMALLIFGVFRGDRATGFVSSLGVVLLVAVGYFVYQVTDWGADADARAAFGGSIVVDRFGSFLKLLVLTGGALALIMSQRYLRTERMARFEYPILILFALLGMMMMISAHDLIALYVGIELQSLSLYVLAAFNRDSQRASEAGLKYFVLSALSSGLLLYGASLVYGFSGSTDFAVISTVVAEGAPIGLLVGLVFMAAGLSFKVSAVPFHMWTPDVYEGAPTPVTAFFAVAPKIAAFAIFIRVMIEMFGPLVEQWQPIIIFISIGSMAVGAFGAIGQNNIKRLMAYSTIGHMGYALIGLAAASEAGVRSVLLYLAIYLATNLGAFVCILAMRLKEGMVENVSALSGLSRSQPFVAAALAIFMFSLAGIPPFAGFFAKLFVFSAALQAGLLPLAIIGVLTSVVGTFYYLRIVKIMYFDEPAEAFDPKIGAALRLILAGSAAFTTLFLVFALPIQAAAARAASALF